MKISEKEQVEIGGKEQETSFNTGMHKSVHILCH